MESTRAPYLVGNQIHCKDNNKCFKLLNSVPFPGPVIDQESANFYGQGYSLLFISPNIYFFGGYHNSGDYLLGITPQPLGYSYKYNIHTHTWTHLPPIPVPTSNPILTYLHPYIHLTNPLSPFNIQQLHVTTQQWTSIAIPPQYHSLTPTSTIPYNGHLFMSAAQNTCIYSDDDFSNTVDSYIIHYNPLYTIWRTIYHTTISSVKTPILASLAHYLSDSLMSEYPITNDAPLQLFVHNNDAYLRTCTQLQPDTITPVIEELIQTNTTPPTFTIGEMISETHFSLNMHHTMRIHQPWEYIPVHINNLIPCSDTHFS